MTHNEYMTDYGPVRVSPGESGLLRYAAEIERGIGGPVMIARLRSLRAACERFAKHKYGG